MCYRTFVMKASFWRDQGDAQIWATGGFFVGAGLLATAVGQLAEMLNVLPSSRASPLPQGVSGGYKVCVHHPFQCGSEPARDGGGSACSSKSEPPSGRNPKQPLPQQRIYTPYPGAQKPHPLRTPRWSAKNGLSAATRSEALGALAACPSCPSTYQ